MRWIGLDAWMDKKRIELHMRAFSYVYSEYPERGVGGIVFLER